MRKHYTLDELREKVRIAEAHAVACSQGDTRYVPQVVGLALAKQNLAYWRGCLKEELQIAREAKP